MNAILNQTREAYTQAIIAHIVINTLEYQRGCIDEDISHWRTAEFDRYFDCLGEDYQAVADKVRQDELANEPTSRSEINNVFDTLNALHVLYIAAREEN